MNRSASWLSLVNLLLLAVIVYMLIGGVPNLLRWKQEQENPPAARPVFYDWLDPSKGMQLIMFYASPGVIERGDSTSLCYGVAQAAKVRLEPAAANMWPSLNRCLSVAPQKDTTYRIFLEDAKGKETSAELTVRVVKPGTLRPVEYVTPPVDVSYFRVKDKFVLDGATCYSLEFATVSAEVVTIEPAVFPAGRVMMGSFYVKPPKTTTYRITAEGKGKKVFKELTVEVP